MSAPAWKGIATSAVSLPGVAPAVTSATSWIVRVRIARTHHSVVEVESIADVGVAVLGYEPESIVLDDVETREKCAVERLTKRRQCLLDRAAPGQSFKTPLSGPTRTAHLALGQLRRCRHSGRGRRRFDSTSLGRLFVDQRRRDIVHRGLVLGDLTRFARNILEDVEDERVELRLTLFAHHLDCCCHRKCRTVDALGRERIEDVRHGRNPPLERYCLPRETVRVSVPVPALVVDEGDRGSQIEHFGGRPREEPMSDLGMALHRPPLLIGERASLEQDLVGDRDLADVVERAGFTQQSTPVLVEAETARDLLAHARHSLGVVASLLITELGRIRKPADCFRLRLPQFELRAAQTGDGVEKFLLRSAPLRELGLHAVVEESIVENDPGNPAELIEQSYLIVREARPAGSRYPDHTQRAFPTPERCSGSRNRGGLRPQIPRGQIAGDRLRLSTRGDASNERILGSNAQTHAVGERADTRRQRQRFSIRLDEVEVTAVDLDDLNRLEENQVEEPWNLVALGNESGNLAQRPEL